MALTRLWRPSPNWSGSRSTTQVICVHTSEGAKDESSLARFLAQSSSAVSYHCLFDNVTSAGQITECVRRQNRSWSAMAANNYALHGCCTTPSGASAGWSRATWLSQATMLSKCASWIAEECAAFGIPVRKIGAAEIRAGQRGVCGHGDVSGAGAGGSHFDPGPQFPWDVVIQMAAGESAAPAPASRPRGGVIPLARR